MTEDEAHQSVNALIQDLRHVMGTRPHTRWPALARKVLDHHTPAIPDRLLNHYDGQIQASALRILDGLIIGDPVEIRANIIDLRRAEDRAARVGGLWPKRPESAQNADDEDQPNEPAADEQSGSHDRAKQIAPPVFPSPASAVPSPSTSSGLFGGSTQVQSSELFETDPVDEITVVESPVLPAMPPPPPAPHRPSSGPPTVDEVTIRPPAPPLPFPSEQR